MDKILAGDELTISGHSNSEIVEVLRTVSPEVFRDGKVDFELLRNVLGEAVEDAEEKYGLNWVGKNEAILRSRSPSYGTLRPSVDDGINTEVSKNVIIEGDNLEVLALLQKAYAGKVKRIYIDPPYNRDGDYIYPDKFGVGIDNYLLETGQLDDEGKIKSTKIETSGRHHSKWLTMMYPRLKLAHTLLRDDGLIFVSIDECEITNLVSIMNEIFGEENH